MYLIYFLDFTKSKKVFMYLFEQIHILLLIGWNNIFLLFNEVCQKKSIFFSVNIFIYTQLFLSIELGEMGDLG